jgi:hypothetical protein
MEVIAMIRSGPSTMIQMFRLALLVALVAGPIRPAKAQLDIPGYVHCYPGSNGTLATTHPNPLIVTINTRELRQKIHHFGASDAWSAQFVGQWPFAKREAIADQREGCEPRCW